MTNALSNGYESMCRERLAERTRTLSLRILSLACAAGEEPYSIAILLSEARPSGSPIPALMPSISVHAGWQNARRGVYSQNAFRGPVARTGPATFDSMQKATKSTSALRAKVRFIQGNFWIPGCSRVHHVYDMIFCRNVLIYLTPRLAQLCWQ